MELLQEIHNLHSYNSSTIAYLTIERGETALSDNE